MGIRALTDRDESQLERFVLMAAVRPDAPTPERVGVLPEVRRWLDAWSELELGVCWEDEGRIAGAAWARRVEPVLVRSPGGTPIPEVVIAVDPERRGHGIGLALMEGLIASAEEAGEPGLCLSVSDANVSAVRLYERVGFVRLDCGRGQFVTMILDLED